MIRLEGGFSLNSVQVQAGQTNSAPFQATFEAHLGHSSGFSILSPIPEGAMATSIFENVEAKGKGEDCDEKLNDPP